MLRVRFCSLHWEARGRPSEGRRVGGDLVFGKQLLGMVVMYSPSWRLWSALLYASNSRGFGYAVKNIRTPRFLLEITEGKRKHTTPFTVHNCAIKPINPIDLLQFRPHRMSPISRTLQRTDDIVLRQLFQFIDG